MTYEYVATATGTHWYHSHWDGDQVGKGLYGSLRSCPAPATTPVDRDYRLFVGDTNLGFVINGRASRARGAAGQGGREDPDPAHAHGELSHPFHLHGQPFQLVAQDGLSCRAPVTMDTLLISTAQTFDIITVTLAPGPWMFHCHIFSHMHAPGAHAGQDGGVVTTLDVAPTRGPAVPSLNGVPAAPARRPRPVTPGPTTRTAATEGEKGGGGAAPAPAHREPLRH